MIKQKTNVALATIVTRLPVIAASMKLVPPESRAATCSAMDGSFAEDDAPPPDDEESFDTADTDQFACCFQRRGLGPMRSQVESSISLSSW